MRHLDADVRAPSAPIKRIEDRYEDMIVGAAEEEGDGRNLLSVSMFREFTGLFAMVNRVTVELA